MANTEQYNVIQVDTTGYVKASTVTIKAIKYVGASGATAVVTAGTTGSGARLYEAAGATSEIAEVCIRAPERFHVTLTSGAKLYIYQE